METPSFETYARTGDPPLDRLALALAGELRGSVDHGAALERLDRLGAELADGLAGRERTPATELATMAEVLGGRHGYHGEAEDYDDPDRSMLDLVLERKVGLPILLSVVYVEVGRRAGVHLAGVGLAGHFVVGHFGGGQPVLADPFNHGRPLPDALAPQQPHPWSARETALRMLNHLVASYTARHDLGRAIRAAELRLKVAGTDREALELELRGLRARLN